MPSAKDLTDEELVNLLKTRSLEETGEADISGPKTRLPASVAQARKKIDEEESKGTSPPLDLQMIDKALKSIPGAGPYVDEAKSLGVTAAGGGKPKEYNDYLAYDRERTRQFDKEDPYFMSTIGNAVGTVGGSILEARGAKGIAPKSTAALEKFFENASKLKKMGAGAAITGTTGTAGGAIGGFGEGEGGFEQRLKTAGQDAFLGALTTPIGLVAPFLGGGFEAAAAKLGVTKAKLKQLYERLNLSPNSSKVVQETALADDALRLDGAGVRRAKTAGPNAIMADTGFAGREAMDYLKGQGGSTGRMIRDVEEGRVDDEMTRFNKSITDAFGDPKGVKQAQKDIRGASQLDRDIEYTEAFRINPDYNTQDGKFIQHQLKRIAPEHWKAVWDQYRHDFAAEPTADIKKMIMESPNTRELDLITRSLAKFSRSTWGTGEGGGQTLAGSNAGELTRTIRTGMKDWNKPYEKALGTARETIQGVKAVEYGAKMMKTNVTPEDVRFSLQDNLGGDVADVREGVANYFQHVMGKARNAVDNAVEDDEVHSAQVAVRELMSPEAKQKLSMILEPKQIDDLFQAANYMRRALIYRSQGGTPASVRKAFAKLEETIGKNAMDRIRKDIGGGVQTIAVRAASSPFVKSATQKEREIARGYKEAAKFLTSGFEEGKYRDLAKLRAVERVQEKKIQNARNRGNWHGPAFAPLVPDRLLDPQPYREEEDQ